MTVPRRQQICLEATPYYHCITRCVRRSFLCGFDKLSKTNFDHRRGWIEERLLKLADAFCIDIAGYAIMSNHYHVVLRVNVEHGQSLTDDEVIMRWRKLYRGPVLVQRYLDDEQLSNAEHKELKVIVEQWRDNLTNISRLMGNLNEYIARLANKEDKCKGRFWESRFKAQAILDTASLLRILCYVDLNPVRAKMAKTPEASVHTSVKRRLECKGDGLMRFSEETFKAGASLKNEATVLPGTFREYLELLDWTGRQLRRGKRGQIENDAPPIMNRLGYTAASWMKTQTPQVSWTQKALGQAALIKNYCAGIGQQWIWRVN